MVIVSVGRWVIYGLWLDKKHFSKIDCLFSVESSLHIPFFVYKWRNPRRVGGYKHKISSIGFLPPTINYLNCLQDHWLQFVIIFFFIRIWRFQYKNMFYKNIEPDLCDINPWLIFWKEFNVVNTSICFDQTVQNSFILSLNGKTSQKATTLITFLQEVMWVISLRL